MKTDPPMATDRVFPGLGTQRQGIPASACLPGADHGLIFLRLSACCWRAFSAQGEQTKTVRKRRELHGSRLRLPGPRRPGPEAEMAANLGSPRCNRRPKPPRDPSVVPPPNISPYVPTIPGQVPIALRRLVHAISRNFHISWPDE